MREIRNCDVIRARFCDLEDFLSINWIGFLCDQVQVEGFNFHLFFFIFVWIRGVQPAAHDQKHFFVLQIWATEKNSVQLIDKENLQGRKIALEWHHNFLSLAFFSQQSCSQSTIYFQQDFSCCEGRVFLLWEQENRYFSTLFKINRYSCSHSMKNLAGSKSCYVGRNFFFSEDYGFVWSVFREKVSKFWWDGNMHEQRGALIWPDWFFLFSIFSKLCSEHGLSTKSFHLTRLLAVARSSCVHLPSFCNVLTLHVADRIFSFPTLSWLQFWLAWTNHREVFPEMDSEFQFSIPKLSTTFAEFLWVKSWWKCDWKLSRIFSGIRSNCCNW